jgi:hypothetical protein
LVASKRSLQIQDRGTVPERIPNALLSGPVPLLGEVERLVGAPEISLDAVGVSEVSPGIGAELIEPAILGRSAFPEGICHGHRQVGEMGGEACIPRSGPPAFAAEELAQTPACEAGIGTDEAQPFLRRERLQPVPELRRLGPGPRQSELDQAEA